MNIIHMPRDKTIPYSSRDLRVFIRSRKDLPNDSIPGVRDLKEAQSRIL